MVGFSGRIPVPMPELFGLEAASERERDSQKGREDPVFREFREKRCARSIPLAAQGAEGV